MRYLKDEPVSFWDVLFFIASICIGRLVADRISENPHGIAHQIQVCYLSFQSRIKHFCGKDTGEPLSEFSNSAKAKVRWTLTSAHIDLIASRKWKDLLVWIVFHPDELMYVDKRNQTVLHHACLFRAPAQIIHMLLYQKPELAHVQNIDDEIPLHWAMRLSAPNEVIKLLLSVYPSSACSVNDKDGNTALSMVWERYESSLLDSWWQFGKQSVIINTGWVRILFFFQCYSFYLESLHCSDSCLEDYGNFLLNRIEDHSKAFWPVHTATQCPSCPVKLYTLLLRVYKDHIYEQDYHGRLPLTIACLNPTSNRSIGVLTKVHLLLAEYPSAAEVKDHKGRLSLFTALESSLTWDEGIDRLIALNPNALLLCDPFTQLSAFLLAASYSQPTTRNLTTLLTIENVSASTNEQQEHWERAHVSTIFSILRKDPAQIHVISSF